MDLIFGIVRRRSRFPRFPGFCHSIIIHRLTVPLFLRIHSLFGYSSIVESVFPEIAKYRYFAISRAMNSVASSMESQTINTPGKTERRFSESLIWEFHRERQFDLIFSFTL